MDLSEPSRAPRTESIVPMINVVFLLLIFFLMTSHLAQPEPFEVVPPHAVVKGEANAEQILFVDKNGRMSFNAVGGEAAIAALAAQSTETSVIQLRADASIEAKKLARILRDLSGAGLSRVELVISPK